MARTDYFEPSVVHQSHERSAAVALARVLAARLVSRAYHVLRDQPACVVRLGAIFVVDDRHVHLPQMARRHAVLVQRAPAGRLSHRVRVRVVCGNRAVPRVTYRLFIIPVSYPNVYGTRTSDHFDHSLSLPPQYAKR